MYINLCLLMSLCSMACCGSLAIGVSASKGDHEGCQIQGAPSTVEGTALSRVTRVGGVATAKSSTASEDFAEIRRVASDVTGEFPIVAIEKMSEAKAEVIAGNASENLLSGHGIIVTLSKNSRGDWVVEASETFDR